MVVRQQSANEACVHSPGQCLPKANAATVYRALQRWAVWSPNHTCSEFLGGQQLASIIGKIPLIVQVCVSDAHPSNDCINALEEQRMLLDSQGADEADCQKQIAARLPALCLQHQASLAKRPSLLSIPGLCSSLVRMSKVAAELG